MARALPRRERRPRPRRGGSDLLARILVAIPAIAFAIFIVAAGGWVFTRRRAGARAALPARAVPHVRARAPGQARRLRRRSLGLAVAAQVGDERQVLLAAVAFLPVMFLLARRDAEREGVTVTDGMAITTVRRRSGSGWRSPTPCCCATPPHGDGIVIDVLVGTFLGDTGAYLGGRSFGTPAAGAADLAEQDRRGARDRLPRRRARDVVRRALPGLALGRPGAAARRRGRRRRAARRPVRVPGQARLGRQGHRARCSAPTAARSTASTPRSSRSSPATTSGSRCSEGVRSCNRAPETGMLECKI